MSLPSEDFLLKYPGQDPANHLPIQQELLAAQRHDDSFWVYSNNKECDNKNNHVPFPFIATCLVVGASYGPDGYFHSTSVESFYMSYDGGDNNNGEFYFCQISHIKWWTGDTYRFIYIPLIKHHASSCYNANITNQELTPLGITIFDITDLSHVCYCFVDFMGMESTREVPLMTPLSARTYLEAYYELTDPKHSEDLVPLVESFRGWDFIATSVLEDAWPEEGWKEAETDVTAGGEEEPELKLEKLEIAPTVSLATLRGRSMDTIIQDLLESPEESSNLVAEVECLTDFLPRLKDKLYDATTTLKWSSHHLDLLYQALKNEIEVDLRPLSNIPAKDLAPVVAKLYENSKMSVLNLSHRPDISLEDLRSIIGTGTRLRLLCLLEMPHIPLESLGQYLVNCEVHHSDLLRWALRDYSFFERHRSQGMVPKVEFSGAGVVSKIVWTGLGSGACVDRRKYLPNGRVAWENLSFRPRNGQFFDTHEALEIRLYDLCVPVAPCKLAPSVLRLLQWMGPASVLWATDVPRGMACSLASSSPCTNTNGHGIGLLDPTLWLAGKYDRVPLKPFSLKTGEWALFLLSKAYDAVDQSFLDDMLERRRDSADSGPPVNVDSSKELSNKNGDPELGSFAQASEVDSAAPKDQVVEFRPRKAASYALVTRVADSGPSQYMVADIPTFLEKVLGHTPETRELINGWTSGFPTIKNAEFFGDDTYKILQKILPEEVNHEGKEAKGGEHGAEHDGTGSTQVGGTGTGDDGAESG